MGTNIVHKDFIDVTDKEFKALEKFFEVKASNKYGDNVPGGLGLLIEKRAEEIPERPAVHFEGVELTYDELNKSCNQVANFFLGRKAEKGMTCALFLENSLDYIKFLAGLAKIGVVSALINTELKKQQLQHVINISNADWIVVHKSLLHKIEEMIEDLNVAEKDIWVVGGEGEDRFLNLDLPLKEAADNNPELADPPRMQELAWYLFTSGTTGTSKAVKSKYKTQLLASEGVYIIASPCSRDDVFYSPLPLNHVWGLMTFCGAMHAGAKFVLRRKFSATSYWEDVRKHNATVGSYIGEIPRYLYNKPALPDDADNPLRKFVGLGLKADLWEKFKERFAIDEIVEVYGASEGGTPLINIAGLPGMIGRLVNPGSVLVKYDIENDDFIYDENGFMMRCEEPGELGVLIFSKKDPSININEYTNKKATDKKLLSNVFEEGDAWFNSGDLFRFHEGRWLSFQDRLGDTFRWKSENVSTQEVESVLINYPAIELAVVYGVEVPNMPGRACMAGIKKNPDYKWDWDDFNKYVTANLANFAIPMFIRFIDKVELTPTHKLKRSHLIEEAYDHNKIKDPLFYRDCAKEEYVLIDDKSADLIKNGKISF